MSPLVNLQFGSVVLWLILQQQQERKTQAGATAAGDWLQVDVALSVTFWGFFFLKHIKAILHMHMFL